MIYFVTATDANGCQNFNTVHVRINPRPTLRVTGDTICPGGVGTLSATSDDSGTFLWAPGGWIGPSIAVSIPGPYTCVFTSRHGCPSLPANAELVVDPPMTADAGHDTTIYSGEVITLGGVPTPWGWGGTPPYSYSWWPTTGLSDYTSDHPTACPLASMDYILTITDGLGCQGVDTIHIALAAPGIPLSRGWNLVSQCVALRWGFAARPPQVLAGFFCYPDSEYITCDSLDLGQGAWILLSDSVTIPLADYRSDAVIVPVHPGWNLLGAISGGIPVSDLIIDPPSTLSGSIWSFTPSMGYVEAARLEPGRGYWALALNRGWVTMRR